MTMNPSPSDQFCWWSDALSFIWSFNILQLGLVLGSSAGTKVGLREGANAPSPLPANPDKVNINPGFPQ